MWFIRIIKDNQIYWFNPVNNGGQKSLKNAKIAIFSDFDLHYL